MANPLVVVDSEIKGRTLQEQYEGELDILVLQAPPVKVVYRKTDDPKKQGEPLFDFAPLASEKEVLRTLLAAAKDREIYLALDCDRRGEYVSWLISEFLATVTKGGVSTKRLSLTGLSREGLADSFRNLEILDKRKAHNFYVSNLFNSALGKHLERLIGTRSGPGNQPLNFPSLTTMFLLAEREEEIKAYNPALKWQVRVKLDTGAGECFGCLKQVWEISDDGFLNSPEEGRSVVALFKDEIFAATHIGRTDFSIPAPPPYRMAELLRDAYLFFAMKPRQVLASAFKLFYGVEVEGHSIGLISSFLPMKNSAMPTMLAALRKQAARMQGEKALGPADSWAGEFEFIVPLRPEISRDELRSSLSEDDCNLYELIRSRALASQMQPATGDLIQVDFKAGEKCIFRNEARLVREQGFLAVYQGWHDRELLQPCALADLTTGQQVKLLQIIPEQSSGAPPQYYSFETLFVDLTDFSIPAEPAVIMLLQDLMDRGYVGIMPDGSLRSQDNTVKVVSTLNRAFPTMTGINLAAYLQQTIDEAVSGRKSMDMALSQFRQIMVMRGKVIAKAAVPQTVQPRLRTSGSIIKSVAPPTPLEKKAAVPASAAPVASMPLEAVSVSGTEPEAVAESVALPDAEPQPSLLQVDSEAAPEEGALPEVPAAAQAPAGGSVAVADEVLPEETVLAAEYQAAAEESRSLAESDDFASVFVLEDVREGLPEEEASAGVRDAEVLGAAEGHLRQEAEEVFAGISDTTQETGVGVLEDVTGPEAAAEIRDCPQCGKELLLKKDHFGKYWACSGYPGCRFAESYAPDRKEQGMACPLCHIGQIIAKSTPAGKIFYVCPEASCDFMAWSKPYDLSCQVCNYPFLVEKKDLAGRTMLRCPRAGCTYTRSLVEEDGGIPGLEAMTASQAVAPSEPPAKKKMVRVLRAPGSTAGTGTTRKVRVVRRKK